MKISQPLDLEYIASRLEGLEETVIFKLIGRAQFKQNDQAYRLGASGFPDEPNRCLLDLRMLHQERMDALFGRFCVPEERPFTSDLPEPKRTVHQQATGLAIADFDIVNMTSAIRTTYLTLLKSLCQPGSDEQFGSSVEHDVYTIQAIARRIHYGALYVAESKYRRNPVVYQKHVEAQDTTSLLALLTRPDVEHQIIERIRAKVAATQERVNRSVRNTINTDAVVDYYHDTIIPLTKQGEVAYLLNRHATT